MAVASGRSSAITAADGDQGHEHAGAEGEPAPCQQAADGGEDQRADQHRADQDCLVAVAERPDRPLLHRGGGQVDHG